MAVVSVDKAHLRQRAHGPCYISVHAHPFSNKYKSRFIMAVPARQLSFRLEDLPVEISTQIWFTIFADLPFAGKVVEVNFSREIIYHKGRDRGYGKPRRIPAKFVNT